MNKIYQKLFLGGKNAGFTLIELLVVVLIIGILAAVAVPQYKKAVVRARLAAFLPIVKDLYEQKQMFYMSNGRYPASFDEIETIPPGFVPHASSPHLMGTGKYPQQIWVPFQSSTVIGLLENGTIGIDSRGFCMAIPSNDFANQVCKSYTGLKNPTRSADDWNFYDPTEKSN